jgi:hypothetical protein
MNDEALQDLWNRSKRGDDALAPDALDALLSRSVRSGWPRLRWNARILTAMLLVATLCAGASLLEADRRTGSLVLRVVVAVTALALALWSARFPRRLREMDRPDVDLATLVNRQLRFFHGAYEGWLLAFAAATWLLSMSITAWVESRGDGFRIVHPVEFVAVSVVQVLLTLVLLRFAHAPLVQRAVAALEDLQAQVADQTHRIESRRGLRRVLFVIVVVVLTGTVLGGFWAWLSA